MSDLDNNLTIETKKNLYGDAFFNMLWTCRADPRFCYRVHVPSSYADENDPIYQVMVIIQPTGCYTENYVKVAIPWADKHHVAIIAPSFPSGLIQPDDFNSYKLLSADGVRYDQVLLAMLEEMKQRYPGLKTDKVFMFGHSGGGQFVNRFYLVHPNRLKAVSIGAPGRPTFINFDEDYFWGVKNFKKIFDKELDMEAVRKVPVQITVGELDTKFIGDSPYGTCRVERMKSLKKNFEENGVKTVEIEILPGLAHEDGDKERVEAAQKFFEEFL